MRRTLVLGFGLFLTLALGASTELTSQVRTELASGASPQTLAQLHLPCAVTIRGENQSAKVIVVDLSESRVKTKRGLWKTLEAAGSEGTCTMASLGFPVRAASKQVTCTLGEACSQDRRYKFKLTYDGNVVWAYYPAANGWTTDTELNLGDVGRHFTGY